MKIIALLPMKGNSERVPNKNLKLFNGVPLYYKVLKTLLKSKYITKVLINTDSSNIIEDVKSNFTEKVEIVKRPTKLIGDLISMNKIIENDIMLHNANLYIQTHSTNPLLTTKSVDIAIERFINKVDNSFDSIFSVTKLQTRLYTEKGKPFNHNPNELKRTQDLVPLFEENSNFFIFTKDSFVKAKYKRIGLNPLMFELDKIEAIDIDEPQDFVIAEAIDRIDLPIK